MNDSSIKDTLEVTNFGPITEAKIDLRPLTVFVGPSNTGKSYLAVLIYALHRHFSQHRMQMRYWHPAERDTLRDALAEWMKEIAGGQESIAENNIVLPDTLREEIRRTIHDRGENFSDELCRCFGMGEANSLIRRGSRKGARIDFRRHAAKGSVRFEQEFVIKAKGPAEIHTAIPGGLQLYADQQVPIGDDLTGIDYLRRQARVTTQLVVREDKKPWDFFSYDLMEHVAKRILPQLLGALNTLAHYLPADRTGAMRAHRVILGSLLDQASQHGRKDPLPDLSGVVTDFLKQLIELGNLSPYRDNGIPHLAEYMEQAMLDGSVDIETSPAGLPEFFYRPRGWKKALPLMHASSMISELAPVVLYLRHVVRPGETLIIDEPEAHLHPAMQAEFTRQIAAFVRSGLRVIVTTHSEWVLETLANLVRASKLPEERRKGIESADPALRPDQVGAWLFKLKMRPRGSVVKEIKMDEETGLFPTDYDDVSLDLYNDGVKISNRTQDSDTE